MMRLHTLISQFYYVFLIQYFFVAIKSKVRNFFYENDYKPDGNFRMRINKIT